MIPLFKVNMPHAVDSALLKTLHSGYITEGPKVKEFEFKFAALMKHENVVAVNSGTSALTLALRLAGVGVGDEVVTTAMTCTATNLPILSLGATPVFADIDPLTGLVRPEDVEGRIRNNTKAIMAVDWGGQPVDVEALMTIAKQHGLKLIVDAAHGIGTSHNQQPDFLCYSLQAIKHITTGDGGILVCKDSDDYQRAKKLRWFGISRDTANLDSRISEDITEWGYKFHMNDLDATIGIVQLDSLETVLERHLENAYYLSSQLPAYYARPDFNMDGSYWIFTMLLPSNLEREEFKLFMAVKEIQVSQVHRRNDEYTVFKPFASKSSPGLELFSDHMICIPCHSGVTGTDLNRIVELCEDFARMHQ